MAIFDYNPNGITPFPYWQWNKVLPAVYDDSVSQYEMLCRLLSVVNNIIESTNSTGEQVEALTQLVQQLIDGEFPSGIVSYVEQIVNGIIEDDITEINSAIQAIQNSIALINSQYQGGDIVIIGDSYDEGYSPDFTDGVGFSQRLAQTLTNVNVYSNHLGGAGLAAGTKPFTVLLNELAATLTDEQRARVTTVVFYGGYNDKGASLGSISSGLSTFLASSKTNFPNAWRIIGAFVGSCVTGKTTGVHASTTYAQCVDALNNWIIAGWYGGSIVSIVNGISVLGCEQNFSSDHVHPSKQGYNCMAAFMAGVVMGTPVETYNGSDGTTILAGEGYTSAGAIEVRRNPYDAESVLFRNTSASLNITYSTPISHTLAINSSLTYSFDPVASLMGADVHGACTAVILDSNNVYSYYPATWHILGTSFIVNITAINAAGNNYESKTIKQLQLRWI